jgi:tRNA (guanine-N7-)-methyltransferase
MPRGKLGRLRAPRLEERTVERYLLWLPGRLLYGEPGTLPEISSPSLFGDGRPLEVEVGCGSGEFLCSLAREDAGANYVGVDLHQKSLRRAVADAAGQGLENVRFVSADFKLAYPLLPDASLRAIYLHFPDPGGRPRDRRKRMFDERFLAEARRALAPGGRLSVMTDQPDYLEDMLSLVDGDFEGGEAAWRRAHEERYLVGGPARGEKSRFQRLWEQRGRRTLRFEVVRREGPGAAGA